PYRVVSMTLVTSSEISSHCDRHWRASRINLSRVLAAKIPDTPMSKKVQIRKIEATQRDPITSIAQDRANESTAVGSWRTITGLFRSTDLNIVEKEALL